ncbi:MAG: hypothetical protein R2909_10540 [Gemmatimonadales bacterium]
MEEELIALGLLLMALLSSAAAGIAIYAWRRAAKRADRLEQHLLAGQRLPNPADVEALLSQVDALASRVDQLNEGHHFLCRLLTRQQGVVPSESRKIGARTPH